MKKAISIILALVMLAVLTSCGRMATTASQAPEASTPTPEASTPTPEASTPTASQTQTVEVLFKDDFQDGNTEGWKISAGWDVQQDGDKYTFMSAGKGSAWVPKGVSWEGDYALKASCELTRGSFGLSLLASSDGRYLLFAGNETISLIREDAEGKRTTLSQAIAPDLSKGATVFFALQQGLLQVRINGQLWLQAQDKNPLKKGTIILGTTESSQAWVDNVVAYRMQKPLPKGEPVSQIIPEAQIVVPEGLDDELVALPESDEGVPELPEENTNDEIDDATPIVEFVITDIPESSIEDHEGEDEVYVDPNQEVYLLWHAENVLNLEYSNGVEIISVPMTSRAVERPQETTAYYLTFTDMDGDESGLRVWARMNGDSGVVNGSVDLVCASASVTPTEEGSKTVQVQLKITNNGSVRSPAFTVRWYSNSDSNVVGASRDFSGLDPGASDTSVFTHTYTDYGTMHWKVVIDADNEVVESNEGNNTSSGTTQLSEGNVESDIDLAFNTAEVIFSSGYKVDVMIVVVNKGSQDSPGFTVTWYPHAVDGVAGKTSNITELPAGSSRSVSFQYDYAAHGTMHWKIAIDASNSVQETNEGNNQKLGDVVVP